MFLGIFYFLKKGNILEDICEDAFNKRCYYNSDQATQGCWCLQLVHSNKPIQEISCAEEVVLVFYFLTSRRRILFTNVGSEEDNFGNVICMMKYYRMTTLLRKKMKI